MDDDLPRCDDEDVNNASDCVKFLAALCHAGSNWGVASCIWSKADVALLRQLEREGYVLITQIHRPDIEDWRSLAVTFSRSPCKSDTDQEAVPRPAAHTHSSTPART